MAVALSTLVPAVKRATSPPGGDVFPDAQDAEWVGRLADAFMNAKLYGLFTEYGLSSDNLSIEPKGSAEDLDETMQRLVVLYAALDVVTTQITNLTTLAKYTAGPAAMETQRSAQVLQAVLQARRADLDAVKNLLATSTATAATFSAISVRDRMLYYGEDYWVRG